MQYTSAEANKLLKKLQDERERLCMEENQSSVFVAATVENPMDVRPDYKFLETQDKISAVETNIRKVKHAINVFNTTHKVDGTGMTIDEVLILLPQITARKRVLQAMASRLPKTRKVSRYGEKSNFIEYEYANYNTEEVKKAYESIAEYLSYVQLALDKANNGDKMEIDVE